MKKTWNGSYTIEASLVLPMIFTVMTAVLFLGFYFHDYAILHITAYEIACYGAEKAESIEEIKSYGRKLLNKALLATELTDIEINLENKEAAVILKGEFESPFFSSDFLGWINKKNMLVKQTAQNPKASNYIRTMNIIIEKLKGLWEEE